MRDRGINERGPVHQRPYGLAAILVHPRGRARGHRRARRAARSDSGQKPSPRTARRRRGGSRRRQRLRCARRARGSAWSTHWRRRSRDGSRTAARSTLQRPVTSQRIMVDVLGLRLSDTDQRAANRVAAVMKRLGWVNRPGGSTDERSGSGTGRTSRRDPYGFRPTREFPLAGIAIGNQIPSSTLCGGVHA